MKEFLKMLGLFFISCLAALVIVTIFLGEINNNTLIIKNTTRITALEHEAGEAKQRQLDLIKYNDCMACHPQEERCELINGEVWQWEEK